MAKKYSTSFLLFFVCLLCVIGVSRTFSQSNNTLIISFFAKENGKLNTYLIEQNGNQVMVTKCNEILPVILQPKVQYRNYISYVDYSSMRDQHLLSDLKNTFKGYSYYSNTLSLVPWYSANSPNVIDENSRNIVDISRKTNWNIFSNSIPTYLSENLYSAIECFHSYNYRPSDMDKIINYVDAGTYVVNYNKLNADNMNANSENFLFKLKGEYFKCSSNFNFDLTDINDIAFFQQFMPYPVHGFVLDSRPLLLKDQPVVEDGKSADLLIYHARGQWEGKILLAEYICNSKNSANLLRYQGVQLMPEDILSEIVGEQNILYEWDTLTEKFGDISDAFSFDNLPFWGALRNNTLEIRNVQDDGVLSSIMLDKGSHIVMVRVIKNER